MRACVIFLVFQCRCPVQGSLLEGVVSGILVEIPKQAGKKTAGPATGAGRIQIAVIGRSGELADVILGNGIAVMRLSLIEYGFRKICSGLEGDRYRLILIGLYLLTHCRQGRVSGRVRVRQWLPPKNDRQRP